MISVCLSRWAAQTILCSTSVKNPCHSTSGSWDMEVSKITQKSIFSVDPGHLQVYRPIYMVDLDWDIDDQVTKKFWPKIKNFHGLGPIKIFLPKIKNFGVLEQVLGHGGSWWKIMKMDFSQLSTTLKWLLDMLERFLAISKKSFQNPKFWKMKNVHLDDPVSHEPDVLWWIFDTRWAENRLSCSTRQTDMKSDEISLRTSLV